LSQHDVRRGRGVTRITIVDAGSRCEDSLPAKTKRPRSTRGPCSNRSSGQSDASGAGKLPLLEALTAEDGPSLGRTEWNCRLLAACRAVGRRFDALTGDACTGGGAGRALGLAALTPFRFVLEILVGKEQLFSCRPEELRPAIHAVEGFVLELHRPYLPLTNSAPARAGRPYEKRGGPRFLFGVTRKRKSRSAPFSGTRSCCAVLNPTRDAASCAYVYAPAPVWRGAYLQASNSRSAS